jgi:tripartite-type tricarboxylate transporter receptor subunit TctC
MNARAAFAVVCFTTTLSLQIPPVLAQQYPLRTVQIYVGTSPGGAVDAVARALADDFGNALGGTFVVVNKEGRNNTIAATQVARSNPDGYTLGFNAAGPFVSDLFTREGIPFKLSQIDFLCQVLELPVAFSVPSTSPIKSISQLVEAAKRAPGAVNVGSVGAGSVPSIALALLERAAGLEFNKISYKGDADTVTALLGGQIDAAVPGLSTVANKGLPILAVSSASRVSSQPDVPTLKELGYPIVKEGMAGLYAPAGMSADIRERLATACRAAAKDGTKLRSVTAKLGQEISYLEPERWRNRLVEDAQENKPIIERMEAGR